MHEIEGFDTAPIGEELGLSPRLTEMLNILGLARRNSYSDVLLSGNKDEHFYPYAGIAVFPERVGDGFDFILEAADFNWTEDEIEVYLRKIAGLELPAGFIARSAGLFSGVGADRAASLNETLGFLADMNMPTGMVVFSGSGPQESAYFFTHLLVPPTEAFRQLKTTVATKSSTLRIAI
jgi:hypothetical protein